MDTLKIRETHTYEWKCFVCDEDVTVKISAPALFLPCPGCGVMYRRNGIASTDWFVKKTGKGASILHMEQVG